MKNCPSCSEKLEDEALKCWFCGERFINEDDRGDKDIIIKKCPSCNYEYDDLDNECQKCGFIFEKYDEKSKNNSNDDNVDNKTEKNSSMGGTNFNFSFGLYQAISLFVLIIIVSFVTTYLFINKPATPLNRKNTAVELSTGKDERSLSLASEKLDEESEVSKVYWPNGILRAEVNIKDGKPDGIAKMYFESGELQFVINYKNGKAFGTFEEYYENGILKSIANFENDEMTGSHKTYDENGTLKKAGNIKINEEEKIEKEYFESGEIAFINTFKNGQYINRKAYNRLGELISEKDWPYIEEN